jgi:hypothetical protein
VAQSLADNALIYKPFLGVSDTNMATLHPWSHSDSDTTVPMVPLCTRGTWDCTHLITVGICGTATHARMWAMYRG